MGRKPVLHSWKDYFAHLEKNENKVKFQTNVDKKFICLGRKQIITCTLFINDVLVLRPS